MKTERCTDAMLKFTRYCLSVTGKRYFIPLDPTLGVR